MSQVAAGGPVVAVNSRCQAAAQGHAAGKRRVARRADRVTRARHADMERRLSRGHTEITCDHDGVEVQEIPHPVVHVIPWPACDVLPALGWAGQLWWVDDVADLCGEVLGGGPAKADCDDGVLVATA